MFYDAPTDHLIILGPFLCWTLSPLKEPQFWHKGHSLNKNKHTIRMLVL